VNYLAHCALGGGDDDLVVGGFLGDFIKGPVPTDLPGRIGLGVRLHRRIDAFSAVQPELKVSALRFGPDLRRVAPVVVDLLADHFLARRFEAIHDEPLAEFAQRTYCTLDEHNHLFPARAKRFHAALVTHSVFQRYTELATVARAMEHIASRLGMPDLVGAAMTVIEANYDNLVEDFLTYYPQLRDHAHTFVQDSE
jgi:acyl carrier protein phosphodiesterase